MTADKETLEAFFARQLKQEREDDAYFRRQALLELLVGAILALPFLWVGLAVVTAPFWIGWLLLR